MSKTTGLLKMLDKKVKKEALFKASVLDDVETVKILIKQDKIDVNAMDVNSVTALMVASKNGSINVAKTLIKAGANVNAKDKAGGTALMYASLWGYVDLVKLLIDAGADVNAKNSFGETALMWASEKGRTEVVKVLLEAGANVNVKEQVYEYK
jgi:ankyrin repeat protein